MPPLYTWIDENTQEQCSVVRSVTDIEIPPTEEESGLKADVTNWRRLMCAGITILHGPNWRYRKGRPY